MYFIIISSSNFEDLLSVNRMFDKGTKKGICIVICHGDLKLKKYKKPVKQLRTDF